MRYKEYAKVEDGQIIYNDAIAITVHTGVGAIGAHSCLRYCTVINMWRGLDLNTALSREVGGRWGHQNRDELQVYVTVPLGTGDVWAE